MRFCNKLLVFAFLALLACPSIASLCHLRPMDRFDEKRALAKAPQLSGVKWSDTQSVVTFTRDWETYYGDNFGLRKLLIGSYRLASLHLFRISLNPAVVVGESDGGVRWLYFDASAAGNGMGLDGFLGKVPYGQAELAAIGANLSRLAKLFADNHTQFLVVVVPDKQTICPEHLPKSLRPRPGTRSRSDQVSEVAERVLGPAYLDLRQAMLQAKSEGILYYPQDTHWNHKAGLLAYQKLMQALQVQDPTRTPMPKEAFRWDRNPILLGDLIDLAGLPSFSREPLLVPVLTSAIPPGHRHGKLLIYYDSYFREFVKPYLEVEFERVRIVYGGFKASAVILTQAELDVEKPDVVIIEAAERFWTW